VWAWRQGRVKTLRQATDRVMCLLPFEAQFLHRHQVSATYTGHPLVALLQQFQQQPRHAPQRLREQLGLSSDDTVLALMPGSRESEIQRLWPLFLRAAERLPQPLQMVTCAAHAQLRPWLEQQHRQLAPDLSLHWLEPADHGSWQALRMADVALLASGTITLEAMLLATPMVVSYRLHALSWLLLKQLRLYKAAHVSLPNLLAAERVVPELLQDQANADQLAIAVGALLGAQGRRQQQRLRAISGQMLTGQQLDAGQPMATAAGVVCAMLANHDRARPC